MQIVIDIDNNLYTRLFDNGDEYIADMRRACIAIRKGISLPEGHGRLIDADALIEKLGIGRDCDVCEKNSTPYCCWNPNVVDVCEAISDAPTIIEADKAESEDYEKV